MTDLTIIKQNGGAYIDSREVAELIGKRHDNLLRDIAGYLEIIKNSNVLKVEGINYFAESTYTDSRGREKPCYLLSKLGCELCANKLIGEKGVIFTAAYVARFNEMEAAERAELEARAAMPAPRLGEYNACARIIVRNLKDLGATPEQIVAFLKGVYEPLGITVSVVGEAEFAPLMLTAKQIAELIGIYSTNGKPHYQAVSCILNENLFIGEDHKIEVTTEYCDHIGISVRYDEHAVKAVMDWLLEYGFPEEVYGFGRTYTIRYRN